MGLFSKPKLKYAGELDLSKTMGEAFSLNNKYFQDAASFTTKVNQSSQKQALDLLEQAMPGISKVRGLLMNQLQEDLTTSGLPREVEENLARKAAEMGVSRGTAGDFNKFSALRDLGIEHTKMVQFRRQMATSALQQLFQSTPRINPMSPTSMLTTPGETMRIASQNLDRRQAFYNAQAQAEAQHKAGIMNAIAGIAGTVTGGFMKNMAPGTAAAGNAAAGGMPRLTTSGGSVNYGAQGWQSVGQGTTLSNPFDSPY